MLKKIIHFVKYNNAFTIILMVIFMGAGVSFASSPELRDNVYSSKQSVTSIDNRLIVSAGLDSYNFNLKITSVTEDFQKYYVSYSYNTLAIQEGIWKEVSQTKTLNVYKEALTGKDLGLYVAKELGDNINSELAFLHLSFWSLHLCRVSNALINIIYKL